MTTTATTRSSQSQSATSTTAATATPTETALPAAQSGPRTLKFDIRNGEQRDEGYTNFDLRVTANTSQLPPDAFSAPDPFFSVAFNGEQITRTEKVEAAASGQYDISIQKSSIQEFAGEDVTINVTLWEGDTTSDQYIISQTRTVTIVADEAGQQSGGGSGEETESETTTATDTPTNTPTDTSTGTPTDTPTPTSTPATPGSAQTPAIGSDSNVSVTLVEVVDGDTLKVRFQNGQVENVRLLGVDTPEVSGGVSPSEFEGVPSTASGRAWLRGWAGNASTFVEQELSGAELTLQTDAQADRRGSYGRLLVYAYYDGGLFSSEEFLNEQLLSEGYARFYDSEFSKRQQFAQLESTARQENRGIWSYGQPESIETPTDTPTSTPTSTPTDTPTDTPTATPAATPTATPTNTPTDTPTTTPTATPTSTPTDTPTPTPIPEGELVIADIQDNAPGVESDNLDKEYVAFRNDGNARLDISGWTVSEGDDNQYTFQEITLNPGDTIRLRTGIGSDTESDVYWGLESPVWNNNGDTITVRDATGSIVIEYQYE